MLVADGVVTGAAVGDVETTRQVEMAGVAVLAVIAGDELKIVVAVVAKIAEMDGLIEGMVVAELVVAVGVVIVVEMVEVSKLMGLMRSTELVALESVEPVLAAQSAVHRQ